MTAIYKISSKIKPERIYIGSAISFKNRKSVHIALLKNNSHFNQILQNHTNKYSIEDLKFEILESVIFKEDLILREQLYLDTLKPYFNICKIAGSILGVKRSEKTKKKMSESLKGRKPTLEHRKKLSLWQKGRKLPEEHKRKISESNKGRKPYKMTDEIRKNISKALKGKRHSEETKRKMSKAQKIAQKGKKASKQAKLNMSKAQKKRFKTEIVWNKGIKQKDYYRSQKDFSQRTKKRN